MASDLKTVTVVPLNGLNYSTWKVQCRMALLKDGLWGIVNGTEVAPDETADADKHAKFIEPKLLYLIGNPEDPVVVWKKLMDQFQKKTWANKLELERKGDDGHD